MLQSEMTTISVCTFLPKNNFRSKNPPFPSCYRLQRCPKNLFLLTSGLTKNDFTTTVITDRLGADLTKNRFCEAEVELIKERHIYPFYGSQIESCKTLIERASIRDDMERFQISTYPTGARLPKGHQ